MVVLGMWIANIGYGIAYAGWRTLQGQQCGLVDAFRGTCGKSSSGGGTGGPAGVTRAEAAAALHRRQLTWLSAQRIISQGTGIP